MAWPRTCGTRPCPRHERSTRDVMWLTSSAWVEWHDNGMNQTLSQGQRNVVAREIGGWRRTALAAVGLMSWLAGGAASFLSKNGAGAAALVAAETVCGVLALMDRWPSRVLMSGKEVSWEV